MTQEVRDKCQNLVMSMDMKRSILKSFAEQVEAGLSKKRNASSSIKCLITYVQDLPDGSERGKFLALDLGGTNFRVLLVELGESHFEMKSKIFAIPQHIMLGSGEQLFDHIADCLAKFIKEEKLGGEKLPLGFTFSFPVTQIGLTRGILQMWTKGFNCSGVVGNDVVQLLKDAIERRGDLEIQVMAILNDSTGTLMSCAWVDHRCRVGVIVGTGSNACYVEKQKNAEFFDEPDHGSGNVIINTEWGAFGDDGALNCMRTPYDEEIDKTSINPGKQLNEKLFSGMYMGELTRLVIEKLTKDGLLFGGKGSDLLYTRGRFYTKYVSEIESDPAGNFTNCREIMEELGIKHATDQDLTNVRYICECVSRRAADLVAIGITALLNKMDDPNVVIIGVDGSLYRFHPHFHNLLKERISQLVNKHLKFELMLSEDGSGRGAALVAAVAAKR